MSKHAKFANLVIMHSERFRQERAMNDPTTPSPFDRGKLTAFSGERKAANPYEQGTKNYEQRFQGYDFIIVADEFAEIFDFA